VIIAAVVERLHDACGDLDEERVEPGSLVWWVGVRLHDPLDDRWMSFVQHTVGERARHVARDLWLGLVL
jgi:hypothetical protein